jgi:hypothetical protein
MRTFRPRLLLSGKQGLGQKHIAAAVLDALDGHHIQSFDLAMLMGDSVRVSIDNCLSTFFEYFQLFSNCLYRRLKQYVSSSSQKSNVTDLVLFTYLTSTYGGTLFRICYDSHS